MRLSHVRRSLDNIFRILTHTSKGVKEWNAILNEVTISCHHSSTRITINVCILILFNWKYECLPGKEIHITAAVTKLHSEYNTIHIHHNCLSISGDTIEKKGEMKKLFTCTTNHIQPGGGELKPMYTNYIKYTNFPPDYSIFRETNQCTNKTVEN